MFATTICKTSRNVEIILEKLQHIGTTCIAFVNEKMYAGCDVIFFKTKNQHMYIFGKKYLKIKYII